MREVFTAKIPLMSKVKVELDKNIYPDCREYKSED